MDSLTFVTTANLMKSLYVVAWEMFKFEPGHSCNSKSDSMPALMIPVDYILVWCSDDGVDEKFDTRGYFWLPQSPESYKALGFVVSNRPKKPQ